MKRTFRKLLESSPTGSGDAPPVFRITSTNLDRHLDRVLAIKAAGDEVRVPLLWQHDRWGPAIGFARCFREAGQWVAALHFDGADELSRTIAAKVKAGTLSACSIGFRPAPEAEPVPNQEGGYDFPLVELLELSVVNVPANQDAVRVRSLDGDDVGASGGDSLKDYRDAQAAFQSLAVELKALVQTLQKQATPAEEEPDEDDEEAESAAEEETEGEEQASEDAAEPDGDEAAAEEEGDEPVEDEEAASDAEESPDEEADADESEDDVQEEEDSEEDAEAPEDESGEDEEDAAEEDTAEGTPEDDAEEDDEELKSMRKRVAKALGFSPAQAGALNAADVRAYAALLPAAA